jgi:phosphohistidine phosphatase
VRLLFIRHAAAEETNGGREGDLTRPLTEEGREKARRMFDALASVYEGLQTIVCSQTLRARQTAEILSESFGGVPVVKSGLLNPGSSYKAFKKLMREVKLGQERIALIGHEPDFSDILGALAADGTLRIDVKKLSCIEVEMTTFGKGKLRVVLPPSVVEALQATGR